MLYQTNIEFIMYNCITDIVIYQGNSLEINLIKYINKSFSFIDVCAA